MSEITDRFTSAATGTPPTGDQRDRSARLTEAYVELAALVEEIAPHSRTRSIALTDLESSLMWANKSIYTKE